MKVFFHSTATCCVAAVAGSFTAMTRPRRNTVLCRRLASQASAAAAAKRQGMHVDAEQDSDSSEEADGDDDIHFLGDVCADL